MVILCSFIGCFHLGVVSLPQLPSCERYLLEALCALDHQARGRWEISRNKKILLPSFSWEETWDLRFMQEYSSPIWTGPVLNNDNDLRRSRDERDAPIAYLVRSAGPKNCSNPVLNSWDNLLWGDALPHGSSSICVLWIVSWELGLDCEAGREAYLPLFQWVQEVSIARTCGTKSFA